MKPHKALGSNFPSTLSAAWSRPIGLPSFSLRRVHTPIDRTEIGARELFIGVFFNVEFTDINLRKPFVCVRVTEAGDATQAAYLSWCELVGTTQSPHGNHGADLKRLFVCRTHSLEEGTQSNAI